MILITVQNVYFAFLKANNNKPLFQLAPMTYKSPKTNKIFSCMG